MREAFECLAIAIGLAGLLAWYKALKLARQTRNEIAAAANRMCAKLDLVLETLLELGAEVEQVNQIQRDVGLIRNGD